VRDRLEPIGKRICAGEHGQHAFGSLRVVGGDRGDPRMRVQRAHHHGVDLPGQIDVVAEAAGAGDQPLILLPADRLSDARSDVHRLIGLSPGP
jgi:hypothetical protein